MRTLVRVVSILAVVAVSSGGRPVVRAASPEDVKTVDAAVYDAIAARDGARLSQMLDDGFMLTNTFGRVYNKKDFLSACCAGQAVGKTLFLGATGSIVRTYGDTVVILARTDMRFTQDTRDQRLAWRSLRVYVRAGDTWKLVAEQRTAID